MAINLTFMPLLCEVNVNFDHLVHFLSLSSLNFHKTYRASVFQDDLADLFAR